MPQCKAKSKRSKKQCLKWAVRGRSTCHMHGGTANGPKTTQGQELSRQAAFKHGGCTKEALAFHKEAMTLIRESKNLLRYVLR